jgi:hypothetical protein
LNGEFSKIRAARQSLYSLLSHVDIMLHCSIVDLVFNSTSAALLPL